MIINIKSDELQLEVDTLGAYQNKFTKNGENLYYPKSNLEKEGKNKLRGGSHVCLPHFGVSEKVNQPNHGFARETEWDIVEKVENKITLVLNEDVEGYENMKAYLTYELEGNRFTTILKVENNGEKPFTISPAFHPYFEFTSQEEVLIDGKPVEFNEELDNSLFEGNIKKLETGRFNISFEEERMPKYVVWSDQIDNYICVEPTNNHKALDDDKELVEVKAHDQEEFKFVIEVE